MGISRGRRVGFQRGVVVGLLLICVIDRYPWIVAKLQQFG
jgi:tetrahydromethanopterin S-methyltransferase subunit G